MMSALARSLARPSRTVATGALSRLLRLLAVRRQRRDLAGLDTHRLRDLGLSHADIRAESARSIRDLPVGWRM